MREKKLRLPGVLVTDEGSLLAAIDKGFLLLYHIGTAPGYTTIAASTNGWLRLCVS